MARKRRQGQGQVGGANIYGVPVRKITEFKPSQIEDLAFWIQADVNTVYQETIKDYASEQSLTVGEILETQFASKLNEEIIAAIVSKTEPLNSLVRLEIDEILPSTFPVYRQYPDRLDTFDISNLLDPLDKQEYRLKLVSAEPLELQEDFSVYTISKGVKIQYLNSLKKIMVVADFVQEPTTTIVATGPQTIPTAEFSEIIIYSRALTQEEDELLRGYLAYRQNTQFTLESTNPYIPDMLAKPLPAISEIATKISDVENAIRISATTMKTAHTDRIETSGEDDITKQFDSMETLVDTVENEITILKNTLSRGILATKSTGSLDDIFTAINSNSMYTEPISQQLIDTKLADFNGKQTKIKEYIVNLAKRSDTSPVTMHKQAIEAETDQRQDMKTEEVMNTTKQQIDARNVYQALYSQQNSLELYGTSFYKTLFSGFANDIDAYVDTFNYHFVIAERQYISILTQFKPIQEDFNKGTSMKKLTTFDMTVVSATPETAVAEQQGGGRDPSGNFVLDTLIQDRPPQTMQYRDPYVNSLQIRYELLRNCILYGDFAYLYQKIERIYSFILHLQDSIEAGDIHPVLQPLYASIFAERFGEFQTIVDLFSTLQDSIVTEMTNFAEVLAVVTTGQATTSSLTDPYSYRVNASEPAYIRRVTEMDTYMYGIEYVVTDKAGKAKGPFPELWFPEMLDLDPAVSGYSLQTPYFSEGEHVNQTYIEIEPFESSLIELLEPANMPAIIEQSIIATYEIPVQEMNSIHTIKTDSFENRILLPVYGLTENQYVVIYNSGSVPIPVIIPGTAAEYTDVVSPRTGTVYIYGKAEDFLYGKVPWVKGTLAYDTLLDCPRTSTCAFVEDLNTFIYVYSLKPSTKIYSALLDSSGCAIEVNRNTDTYVYDLDDAFHACPFTVQTIASIDMATLQRYAPPARRTLTLRKIPQIHVIEDTSTHLPILCSATGNPGINQYGYVKICQNPILLINGELKTRGAYGDIVLKPVAAAAPAVALTRPRIEPFVSFEYLFRPHFVLRSGTDYVFATYSTFPVATPDGTTIQVDSVKKHSMSIVYYDDGSPSNNAFIIDETVTSDAPKKSYPYVDIEAYRNGETHRDIVMHCVSHYDSSLAYLTYLLETLESDMTLLESFDEYETANSLSIIKTTIKSITVDKEQLESLSDTLEKVKEDPTVITEDVKVSMDTLNASLAEVMQNSHDSYSIVSMSMGDFKDAIAGITMIKANKESLQDKGVGVFKTSMTAIHSKIQGEIASRMTTSAPDLEVLLEKLVVLQTEFTAEIAEIDLLIKKQPKYMNAIQLWLKDLQARMGDATIHVQRAEQIVDVEVDQAIMAYKRNEEILGYTLTLRELETKFKQLGSKRIAVETTVQPLDPSDPLIALSQNVENAFDVAGAIEMSIRKLKTTLADPNAPIDGAQNALEQIRSSMLPISNAIDAFTQATAAKPVPQV